jgi:L-threonylcarbamoyladenylate synthase
MPATVLSAYSAVALDHVAQVLEAGQLVVVPTDTVYGLAAALDRLDAIGRIYEVKRRPPERPIALLVDRIADVEQVSAEIPALAKRLMEKLWPGAVTLVLPRGPSVPDIVAAGGPTVAVRMPDHPVPRALIRRLGAPMPTTSANRSGQPSPVTAQEALAEIGDDVAIVLDSGPAPGGVDSTVIDLTATPPRVLRLGALSVDTIEGVLGQPIVVGNA